MTNVGAAPQRPPLGGTPTAEPLKLPNLGLGESYLSLHTLRPRKAEGAGSTPLRLSFPVVSVKIGKGGWWGGTVRVSRGRALVP